MLYQSISVKLRVCLISWCILYTKIILSSSFMFRIQSSSIYAMYIEGESKMTKEAIFIADFILQTKLNQGQLKKLILADKFWRICCELPNPPMFSPTKVLYYTVVVATGSMSRECNLQPWRQTQTDILMLWTKAISRNQLRTWFT